LRNPKVRTEVYSSILRNPKVRTDIYSNILRSPKRRKEVYSSSQGNPKGFSLSEIRLIELKCSYVEIAGSSS
jgi:hypothetical protein